MYPAELPPHVRPAPQAHRTIGRLVTQGLLEPDPHFGRAGLGGTVLELGRRLIHAMSVLRSAGHEVEWVGDWSGDPGDEHILATAAAHGQALVTLDQDFGEWAVLY